ESEIYFKLKEAEMQARLTNQRFSHKEVFNSLRQTLMEKADNENV
ncbi:MAG TPA: prevent-host-death protein, partial [Syntrophomonas sp.]|nr:prevent-host-death protein [Syntrophomonas sp.]